MIYVRNAFNLSLTVNAYDTMVQNMMQKENVEVTGKAAWQAGCFLNYVLCSPTLALTLPPSSLAQVLKLV